MCIRDSIKKSAWLTFTEFLHEVNHTLMNDFVSMPNDEICHKRKGIPCTETGSACRDRYTGTVVPAWDGSSCVWTCLLYTSRCV